ncbi:MAG: four helix bundle protein [Bacteroidota bacterium]
MRNYKDNPIVKMTFQFSLAIIEFFELLGDQKRFAFADQVLRAGCSIGANVKEAQSAESKADFIHKIKITSKEAEETEYPLELCDFARNYPKPGSLLNDIEGILKVLSKIVSTTRKTIKGTK